MVWPVGGLHELRCRLQLDCYTAVSAEHEIVAQRVGHHKPTGHCMHDGSPTLMWALDPAPISPQILPGTCQAPFLDVPQLIFMSLYQLHLVNSWHCVCNTNGWLAFLAAADHTFGTFSHFSYAWIRCSICSSLVQYVAGWSLVACIFMITSRISMATSVWWGFLVPSRTTIRYLSH